MAKQNNTKVVTGIPEKMKSILAQLHNRIDDTTTDQGGGA